VHAGN